MAFEYKNELKTKKERAIIPAIFELDRIESSFKLKLDKQTKEKVLRDYEILYKEGFTNGRRRSDVLKVLIYINLRNLERPVMIKDLEMNRKLFKKYLYKTVSLLGTKLKQKSLESYILRFGFLSHLKQNTISVALILSKINIKVEFETRIMSTLLVASTLTGDRLSFDGFVKDRYFNEACEKLRKKIKGNILKEVNKYAQFSNESK